MVIVSQGSGVIRFIDNEKTDKLTKLKIGLLCCQSNFKKMARACMHQN